MIGIERACVVFLEELELRTTPMSLTCTFHSSVCDDFWVCIAISRTSRRINSNSGAAIEPSPPVEMEDEDDAVEEEGRRGPEGEFEA